MESIHNETLLDTRVRTKPTLHTNFKNLKNTVAMSMKRTLRVEVQQLYSFLKRL